MVYSEYYAMVGLDRLLLQERAMYCERKEKGSASSATRSAPSADDLLLIMVRQANSTNGIKALQGNIMQHDILASSSVEGHPCDSYFVPDLAASVVVTARQHSCKRCTSYRKSV